MKEKTCCFTGHRQIYGKDIEKVKENLKKTIVNSINQGYIYYGAGGALGFDTIAALTVLELKKDYPYIKLILVLPCLNQTKGWSKKDIAVYEYIKANCDKCVYGSKEYTKGCMLKRNRHLVDNSSLCICYLTKSTGGTAYTVRYARQKNLKVINLADHKD